MLKSRVLWTWKCLVWLNFSAYSFKNFLVSSSAIFNIKISFQRNKGLIVVVVWCFDTNFIKICRWWLQSNNERPNKKANSHRAGKNSGYRISAERTNIGNHKLTDDKKLILWIILRNYWILICMLRTASVRLDWIWRVSVVLKLKSVFNSCHLYSLIMNSVLKMFYGNHLRHTRYKIFLKCLLILVSNKDIRGCGNII